MGQLPKNQRLFLEKPILVESSHALMHWRMIRDPQNARSYRDLSAIEYVKGHIALSMRLRMINRSSMW